MPIPPESARRQKIEQPLAARGPHDENQSLPWKGCVRMRNSVILEIAKITPLLGTPVTITA
jgi:uncharacterized protein with HEPN domain